MPDNKCYPPLVPVFVLCGDQFGYGPSERTFIVGPDRAITRNTTWLAEDATGPIPPGFLSPASQARFGSEPDIPRLPLSTRSGHLQTAGFLRVLPRSGDSGFNVISA